MQPTGRLYACACCRALVIVCRACDRGHVYCSRDCWKAARRARQREAGRRYQRTRPGRTAHAARMRRFRHRRNKVTHHGSAEPAADALLAVTSTTSASEAISMIVDTPPATATSAGHCHFCRQLCEFVRHGPLRRRVFHEIRTTTDTKGHDP